MTGKKRKYFTHIPGLAEKYFTPLHYGWLGKAKRRRTRLSVASKIAKIAQMSFKAVAFSFKRKK